MKRKIALSFVTTLILSQSIYANNMKQLDTVTVTAQKVEEDLQEVPIAISVLDEFDIEDNNIKSISDITSYIPNFQQFSTGSPSSFIPSIRGVTSDITSLSSTGVGTYIDGISYTNNRGNNMILDDISSIEVLRGPQGTLYGKNAYGGVINITTKKPNNETRRKISTSFGEDNKREYNANISGPIIQDKFYAGFSIRHYEKDGYIKNEYLNKYEDYAKNDSYKLNLRTTPTDNLDISLISTYFKRDDGAFTMTPRSSENVRVTNSDLEGFTESTSTTYALNISYTMNDFDFTSVSTYKDYSDDRAADFDYTANSSKQRHSDNNDGDVKNYSQEFRLNGEKDRFKWLAGIYLEKQEQDLYATTNSAITRDNSIDTQSLGIFVNGDYSLEDNIVLTAGLRYDKDEVEIDDHLSTYNDEKSYSELSPKVGLKYIVDTNFMTYLTISKGYKAGGFHAQAPADLREFDKETMWNYELGMKTQSLDNRLTLNLAAFYMDIEDMQVTSNITGFTSYLSNAATATSKGIEIETNYQLNDNLNIFANLGYAQTKFDKFKDNLGDYSNNYNPLAPKYNYSIGAKYRDDRGIYGQIDFNGQSSFYADKANTFKNSGYTIANTKIGYETDNYDIYLYCNNITDRRYDIDGFYGFFTVVSPPRETGIQLTYRF